VAETPAYDVTIFKVHYGKMTLKIYTKGERVTLELLPEPAQIGRTRVGGMDLNKPRMRRAVQAVLALSASRVGSRPQNWSGRSTR
jgi:hypothetical protein